MVAVDLKNGIGFQGGLPWPRLEQDMKNFALFTKMNHRAQADLYQSVLPTA